MTKHIYNKNQYFRYKLARQITWYPISYFGPHEWYMSQNIIGGRDKLTFYINKEMFNNTNVIYCPFVIKVKKQKSLVLVTNNNYY